MELNSLIFPTFKSSYTKYDFPGKLMWIPKQSHFTYKEKRKYNSLSKCLSISNNQINKIPTINFSFENKFTNHQRGTSVCMPFVITLQYMDRNVQDLD